MDTDMQVRVQAADVLPAVEVSKGLQRDRRLVAPAVTAPEYAWAISQRRETYRLMERYDDALADFNRAIELDPNDEDYAAKRADIYQLKRERNEDTSIEESSLERPLEN
jgi:tetratricopeptide (TPR) repeat protein